MIGQVWLILVAAAAFGAVFGSFLNVVIHRVPRKQSIVRPGSRCGSCETLKTSRPS